MNLGFHTGEEDFNASMSVLSIYHQDLMDNFTLYANLHEQKMRKPENQMITYQGFIHFMKIMDIAQSRDEASNASEAMRDIDGVMLPFENTLHQMNGLNYAQFLEAILRIAYWKKDNSDQAKNHDGFKNTLEAMFADADLDLGKRTKADDAVESLVKLANEGFWREHFDLLAAIFLDRGIQRNDHFELSKNDFV